MKPWKERTKEEAHLLNPAFCSAVLTSSVIGYSSEDTRGLPYPLAFLVIPIVLHKTTRESLPRTMRTSLVAWIQDNSEARIQLHERITSLVPFVKESILFGVSRDWLFFGEVGLIKTKYTKTHIPAMLRKTADETQECLKCAHFVGRWFALAGTTETATELSKAFALAVPHKETIKIRDELSFFQEVRSGLAKATIEKPGKPQGEMDSAIRQLLSRAITSNEVIDLFSAAALKKPDLSILSDDFLQEMRGLQHKNLAVEMLKKPINDEITVRSKKNLVQSRSFVEMLEEPIRRYQNRSIDAAGVIEELIKLAEDIREALNRGEELHLTEDELAFYDALGVNDSAVKVLGDDCLRQIARELVRKVRNSIDYENGRN